MSKYCTSCGRLIDDSAAFCTACGARQSFAGPQCAPAQNVIINNVNTNMYNAGTQKDKWVAVLLCLFLGCFGAHKFYEGRIGLGILYIFTLGLFGIGVLVDFIVLLCKPNPYYVR